jgi:hypothetical protein
MKYWAAKALYNYRVNPTDSTSADLSRKMSIRVSHIAALLLSAAGCSSPPAVLPWNGKLTHEIPEPLSVALEQATEFQLFSLDPKHRNGEGASEVFHRKVIGKTVVDDARSNYRRARFRSRSAWTSSELLRPTPRNSRKTFRKNDLHADLLRVWSRLCVCR